MTFSDFYSDQPEKLYSNTVSQAKIKEFAQFFTPFEIAHFMASWVIGKRKNITLLDPAMGLGVLLRAAYQIENSVKMIGYDIDACILEKAQTIFSQYNLNLTIKPENYLYNDWDNQYDGIICNPPYFKFQEFKDKNKALKEFIYQKNIKLSGFSNIYTLFLIKSLYQLKEQGRAAYLIPTEFFNADYGVKVKEILLKHKQLRYIINFDVKTPIFETALTTSSLLLLANDGQRTNINFINVNTSQKLLGLKKDLVNYPNCTVNGNTLNYSQMNPKIKWRIYFNKYTKKQYKNLVPFSNYAQVVRGIATGANDYFTFNKTKQKEFKIKDQYLLPCISKANQVTQNIFTQTHFKQLNEQQKNIFLFNAKSAKDRYVQEYLDYGESLNIHKRYLTRHRNPWYLVENRPPSPIWVGVFNRNGLKFVKNEANIRTLTAFHCIYVNLLIQDKIDLFFAYLLTDVAHELFRENRREYGGGLEKFEPNDLNQSPVLNLDIIDYHIHQEINVYYQKYRQAVINTQNSDPFLSQLNNIFLILLNQ